MASSSRPRFAFALLPLAGAWATLIALPAPACGDGGLAGDFSDTDAQAVPPLPEGGPTGDDGGAPATTVRIAHLAPGLGAIDFCWRPVNTGIFEGPVLGGAMPMNDAGADADADADADAAEAEATPQPGLVFRTVSTYQTLAGSGAITIAIVARGQPAACANPLAQGDVTLDAGKLATVVVLGRKGDAGAASLDVVAFTDDRTTTADKARVRLVHAASAGTLSVRASSGTTVTLADELLPRHVASMLPLGYATVTPVPPPASLAITETAPLGDASAATWQSSTGDLGLAGGSLHTGFVLDGEGAPFEVLWCTDTSTTADHTTCARVR